MTLIEDGVRLTVVGAPAADTFTVAASEGGTIVGQVVLSRLYGPRAELTVAVDGREAVAERLLEAAEEAALDRGISRLEIDAAGAPAAFILALATRSVREERRGDDLYLTWPAAGRG
jgi:hypothetical protein